MVRPRSVDGLLSEMNAENPARRPAQTKFYRYFYITRRLVTLNVRCVLVYRVFFFFTTHNVYCALVSDDLSHESPPRPPVGRRFTRTEPKLNSTGHRLLSRTKRAFHRYISRINRRVITADRFGF